MSHRSLLHDSGDTFENAEMQSPQPTEKYFSKFKRNFYKVWNVTSSTLREKFIFREALFKIRKNVLSIPRKPFPRNWKTTLPQSGQIHFQTSRPQPDQPTQPTQPNRFFPRLVLVRGFSNNVLDAQYWRWLLRVPPVAARGFPQGWEGWGPDVETDRLTAVITYRKLLRLLSINCFKTWKCVFTPPPKFVSSKTTCQTWRLQY